MLYSLVHFQLDKINLIKIMLHVKLRIQTSSSTQFELRLNFA